MYAWLWRRIPGGVGTKTVTMLLLALAACAALWLWVFPWAATRLPFIHP
jgi:hypothetical protein